MDSNTKIFIIEEADECDRLDRIIVKHFPEHTRSYIQQLINIGNVTVNDNIHKANYKCRKDDVVKITIPEPVSINIEAEDIPLNIVYEDEDILIVNKPKGMVVHPSSGHYKHTLVNALMYHCKGKLSGINGVMRPGIVHRIDQDTTGLLIICKNDSSHRFIAEQLKNHTITRRYCAIVHGNIKEDDGIIDAPIGRHPVERKKMAVNYKNGKPAITHYKVLMRFGQYTMVQCELETGRTHQIRVHMSSIHHPLLGDTVYGGKSSAFHLQGQCLHAKVIGFIHPRSNEYMEFDSELPEYFKKLIKKLNKN